MRSKLCGLIVLLACQFAQAQVQNFDMETSPDESSGWFLQSDQFGIRNWIEADSMYRFMLSDSAGQTLILASDGIYFSGSGGGGINTDLALDSVWMDADSIYFAVYDLVNSTLERVFSVPYKDGEINVAINVGTGAQVFKDKVDSTFRFRSVIQEHGIEVSEYVDEIGIKADTNILATKNWVGERDTIVNIGVGYDLYSGKIGNNFELRSIFAGYGIEAGVTGNTVTIAADTFLMSTKAYAEFVSMMKAKNIGSGAEVFAGVMNDTIQLRTLIAGANISIDSDSETITINNTAEPSTATNVGDGEGFFLDKQNDTLRFKSLTATGAVITATDSTVHITIPLDSVYTDNTITGSGLEGDPLGVDTNLIATQLFVLENAGEINVGANLGGGLFVYHSKTDTTLNFRSIVAGYGTLVDYINDAQEIRYSSDTSVLVTKNFAQRYVIDALNMGSGAGIYIEKAFQLIRLKSILGGGNVVITEQDSTITISSTGEVNEAVNVGGELEVFKQKTDTVFEFRTLEPLWGMSMSQGASVISFAVDSNSLKQAGFYNSINQLPGDFRPVLEENSGEITFSGLIFGDGFDFNNTGIGEFTVNADIRGENIGTGSQVYHDSDGFILTFRTLLEKHGINITQTANELWVEVDTTQIATRDFVIRGIDTLQYVKDVVNPNASGQQLVKDNVDGIVTIKRLFGQSGIDFISTPDVLIARADTNLLATQSHVFNNYIRGAANRALPGYPVYFQNNEGILEFKRIIEGYGMDLLNSNDAITINSDTSFMATRSYVDNLSLGEINSGVNLGAGSEVYAGDSGNDLTFRTLVAGYGVNIAQTAQELEIEADTNLLSTKHYVDFEITSVVNSIDTNDWYFNEAYEDGSLLCFVIGNRTVQGNVDTFCITMPSGADGVSVVDAYVTNDSLYVELSDATVLGGWYVKGDTGEAGADGMDGANCFRWESSNAGFLPGSGLFSTFPTNEYNVQQLRINTTNSDNVDVVNWVANVEVGDYIHFSEVGSAEKFGVLEVTNIIVPNSTNYIFSTTAVDFAGTMTVGNAHSVCVIKNGSDGADGAAGADGMDGADGADGVSVVDAYVTSDSLYVELSDATVLGGWYVKGDTGEAGADGMDGADGAAGMDASNCFRWMSGQGGTSPGSAEFSMSPNLTFNADFAYINIENLDNVDVTAWLEIIEEDDYVHISEVSNPQNFGLYRVRTITQQSASVYRIQLIVIAFNNTVTDGVEHSICLVKTGQDGADGSDGQDGSDANIDVINLGQGKEVFKEKSGDIVKMRTLETDRNINITQKDSILTFSENTPGGSLCGVFQRAVSVDSIGRGIGFRFDAGDCFSGTSTLVSTSVWSEMDVLKLDSTDIDSVSFTAYHNDLFKFDSFYIQISSIDKFGDFALFKATNIQLRDNGWHIRFCDMELLLESGSYSYNDRFNICVQPFYAKPNTNLSLDSLNVITSLPLKGRFGKWTSSNQDKWFTPRVLDPLTGGTWRTSAGTDSVPNLSNFNTGYFLVENSILQGFRGQVRCNNPEIESFEIQIYHHGYSALPFGTSNSVFDLIYSNDFAVNFDNSTRWWVFDFDFDNYIVPTDGNLHIYIRPVFSGDLTGQRYIYFSAEFY